MLPDFDSLREINSGREVFYNFLSRGCQAEAKEEYLEMAASLMPYIEDMASQTDAASLNEGVKLLAEYTNQWSNLDNIGKKEFLLGLARDFAYLFLTGAKSVPTCESVYLSPEHLVKHGPYLQVLQAYQKVGFQTPVEFKEPEDHVAMEFKFMAILSNKIGRAVEAGENQRVFRLMEIQRAFLDEHLNKWIPQFCRLLIERSAGRNFYRALAHLTEGFLAQDNEFLQDEMWAALQESETMQAGD
ncbi:Chaperone protein TorD [Anaerolineales bacterium]|nr:Chaperone protein TorD [Anaerolineales bacterium]